MRHTRTSMDPASSPHSATQATAVPTAEVGGRRFLADSSGERQAAALRLSAAAVAAFSGIWLLAVTDSWLLRGTALVSILFATLWGVSLARRRQPDGPSNHLEIGRHHLRLAQDGQARSVALRTVRSVEIDQDRLIIVLCLDGDERLTLDACYVGIGLQDLAELLHQAVFSSREDASGQIMATIATDGRA